jgi:hypothetical protein
MSRVEPVIVYPAKCNIICISLTFPVHSIEFTCLLKSGRSVYKGSGRLIALASVLIEQRSRLQWKTLRTGRSMLFAALPRTCMHVLGNGC